MYQLREAANGLVQPQQQELNHEQKQDMEGLSRNRGRDKSRSRGAVERTKALGGEQAREREGEGTVAVEGYGAGNDSRTGCSPWRW